MTCNGTKKQEYKDESVFLSLLFILFNFAHTPTGTFQYDFIETIVFQFHFNSQA